MAQGFKRVFTFEKSYLTDLAHRMYRFGKQQYSTKAKTKTVHKGA